MVVLKPNVPAKPMTLYVNPACDDVDEVYRNGYKACTQAIQAAMEKIPGQVQLHQALKPPGNPFYTPEVKGA